MRVEELIMISNIDHHQMNGTIIRPDKVEKIVLFIHGMADHETRYHDIAKHMAKHNALVLLPDLRGHGRSFVQGKRGYFSKSEGYFVMVRDLYQLVNQIRQTYPVDVTIMGHSMGALFALDYVKRYPRNINKVIISGLPRNIPMTKVAKGILSMVPKSQQDKENINIQKMMNQTLNRMIDHPKTELDWISNNPQSLQRYIDDPQCGFAFTTAGYLDLLNLMDDVYSTPWRTLNPALEIYMLGGRLDPVSNPKYKGLNLSESFLISKGYNNITKVIYPNSRHEIFFDNDKERVLSDLDFIMGRV